MNGRNGQSFERAIAGAAWAPLSDDQKRDICKLARRVWDRLGQPGFADQPAAIPPETRLSVTEAFTLWRQAQQSEAVGHAHLTACTQRQFPLIFAHLVRLGGAGGLADRWAARSLGDPVRQARHLLEREFVRARDVIDRPAEYVASIAKSRFKTTDLAVLSARQLWSLLFDLRRNAQRRRAKGDRQQFSVVDGEHRRAGSSSGNAGVGDMEPPGRKSPVAVTIAQAGKRGRSPAHQPNFVDTKPVLHFVGEPA